MLSIVSAARPVAEYGAIDRQFFRETIRPAGQPAVFRAIARSWPAVSAALRSDEDLVAYLEGFDNGGPVTALVGEPQIDGRFFYKDEMRALNFQRGRTLLPPFLQRLLRDRGEERPFAMAVQSATIADVLPGFERENRTSLVHAAVAPRAWIGNRIRVVPHYDLKENIGVVVAGRRRFTLFPPEQLRNLYAGPFELTPAGTPVSLVDIDDPDLERFPRFVDAMQAAQAAELEPGDAIYIPFHWWHAVDSLEPLNLFVNYWWNEAKQEAGSPYDALMYGFYALKNLPPEQREVWRMIFDHYVFCTEGDPGEHLPEHARGVLGNPTPQLLGRMRLMLKQIMEGL